MKHVVFIMQRWMQAIVELVLALPLLIVLYVSLPFAATFEGWLAVLGVFYLVGIVSAYGLQDRLIVWYVLIAIVSAVAAVKLLWGLGFAEIVTVVLCIAVFYRGCLLSFHRWSDVLPIAAFWLSLAVYFVASIAFKNLIRFDDYLVLLAVAGFATLIMTLWRTNVVVLREVNFSDEQRVRVAASIIRHNRIALFVILLVILLITYFKFIQNTVSAFFNYLIARFHTFIATRPNSDPGEIVFTPPSLPELGGGRTAEGSSFWSDLFLFFGYIVTGILVVILAYFTLRKIWRLLRAGGRRFVAWLRERGLMWRLRGLQTATGYVDEQKKLATLKDVGKYYRERIGHWFAERLKQEPRWRDLQNNKERIRYLYRHWLLRKAAAGYQVDGALTPREIGDKFKAAGDDRTSLVELYELARYGGGDDEERGEREERGEHEEHEERGEREEREVAGESEGVGKANNANRISDEDVQREREIELQHSREQRQKRTRF